MYNLYLPGVNTPNSIKNPSNKQRYTGIIIPHPQSVNRVWKLPNPDDDCQLSGMIRLVTNPPL